MTVRLSARQVRLKIMVDPDDVEVKYLWDDTEPTHGTAEALWIRFATWVKAYRDRLLA